MRKIGVDKLFYINATNKPIIIKNKKGKSVRGTFINQYKKRLFKPKDLK